MTGVSARIRAIAVFEFWWEELERILYSDSERAIVCLHVLARILDDCFIAEEQQKESEERDGHFSLLSKLVGMVMQDFAEVAESAFQLTSSITNPGYCRAILRLMVALKQACWMSGDDFYVAFPHDSVEQFLEEHSRSNFADAVFEARYAFLAGEFVEDTNADLPFNPATLIQTAISKFQEAKRALESRNQDVESWMPNQRIRAAFILNSEVPVPVPDAPPDAPLQASQWCQDEEQVNGSTDQLLMFTAGNLRFLASTADYSEALPFAIEANLVASCLELLDCPYFPLQLFALSWFVNALTHKKIAVELVEKGGMQKIMSFTRTMQSVKNFYTILAPYTTFILVALSKHSQPMEALLREYTFAKQLLLFGCEFMGENGMDGKLNIVEWFGEIFGHPIMLQLAQEIGVIPLVAWELKQVLDMDVDDKMGPIKPAFIKEAVRSLLKYININLYWAVQYSKGSVSELTSHSIASNGNAYLSCSIVRVDEQQMQSLELYVLRYLSMHNQFPPGMKIDLLARFKEQFGDEEEEAEMTNSYHHRLAVHFTRKSYEDDTVSVVSQVRNVSPDWNVAKAYLDYDVIPLLLMLLNMEGKDSNLHTLSLQALQLLCLDSACAIEIQHCIPYAVIPNKQEAMNDMENLAMKKGLEILLHVINPNVRRDPLIITSTLKVLCAMCTPPQYRYNGNSTTEAEKLLAEFQKRQGEQLGAQGAVASSARKRLSFDTAKKPVFVRETQQSKFETAQSAARIGVRTYAGISSLVQLLYFRRHQNYAFSVRLETIKILIGIAHDKEICQILSKMRVNTIISNQLQISTESAWFDNGQSINNAEKDMLVFYSSILSDAIFTNVPISERNIDATQEALTRKSIVEKSHIDFDEDELMELIKEHLFSKGMYDTVAALQVEQSQIKASGTKVEVCQPTKPTASAFSLAMKSPAPSIVPAPSSSLTTLNKKRPRSTSPEPIEAEDQPSSRKIMRRLSHELQTPGWQDSMSFARSNSFVAPEGSSVSIPSGTAYFSNHVTIAWSQRRKNVKKAIKDASYSEVLSSDNNARSVPGGIMASPQPTKASVPVQSEKKQESAKTSKLSAIMTRYLKLQHSQCKHPVATLPLMSICKPHVCPRPKTVTRMNISNIVQPAYSLRNTTWYNYPRFMENFQQLRYVYSSYKPLRTFRYIDNECAISAAGFSHDSTKLWIAHVPAWDGTGPGLALTNYLSGIQETILPGDLQELGGSITQITLSPMSSPNPLIMLSVTADNAMRGAEHKVMLWKDVGTVETFDSRCSHNIQVQTPNNSANTDAGPIEAFWEECFSKTGSHLGVVYSLDRSGDGRADPYGAAVIDLQSGATVYNIVDQDNMQSYDRPQISFVGDDEHLLVFDGKLWDIRSSQCVHRFDKLSNSGMTAVHPCKPEILIDSSVWDLRTFNLAQTIPILDGCKMNFNTVHSVLFAHKVPNFQEFQPNIENNFFHVLDASYYQHLHTEMIDKENMELWDVHVDRHGLGYLATLGGSSEDSLCRVMEIGKRRVVGDGDSGDEDEEDDDEMDEDDEDWYNSGYGGRGPDEDDSDSENDFDEDSEGDEEGDEEGDNDDDDENSDEIAELGGDYGDEDEDEDSDYQNVSESEGSPRRRGGDDEEGWETVSEEDDV